MKYIIAFLALIATAFCLEYAITFKAQVDTAALVDPISRISVKDLDFISKGRLIYNALKSTAELSQKHVREMLDARGISYTSYIITNSIILNNPDQETIEELAKRDEIESVRVVPNFKVQLEKPTQIEGTRQGVEWNVEWVKAPEAWKKGHTGEGVIVGVLDTGCNVQHQDLVSKYRGTIDGTHDYNWKDGVVAQTCKNAPCDQHGHGSHVTGTILGSNEKETVGVAPKATFIQCRSFATGGAGIRDIMNCFEWFLAPTKIDGSDPNPDKRPHVINHSWGGSGRVQEFITAIQKLQDAGSLQVFAAGNSGSRCSSLGYPGAIEEVLTVGALGVRSREIIYFSSRGPAPGNEYVKPNVVAPGTSIRSCSHRGNGYATMSGTSMATPAVTGSVALVFSAKPELIGDIEGTKQHMQNTADPIRSTDCQSKQPHPNNVYGWGLVDNDKATE